MSILTARDSDQTKSRYAPNSICRSNSISILGASNVVVRPPMLNAKSSENFQSQKIVKFRPFTGAEGQLRGKRSADFTPQKAHPYVNPRRLNHFASKLVGGSDLQACC